MGGYLEKYKYTNVFSRLQSKILIVFINNHDKKITTKSYNKARVARCIVFVSKSSRPILIKAVIGAKSSRNRRAIISDHNFLSMRG